MRPIIVRTQTELDAALLGKSKAQIHIDSPRDIELVLNDTHGKTVVATNETRINVNHRAYLIARDYATVMGNHNAHITAHDNVYGAAYGTSIFDAHDSASVILSGNSNGSAYDNATLYGNDYSTLNLWDNAKGWGRGASTIYARNGSTFEAGEQTVVNAYNQCRGVGGPQTAIFRHSLEADILGPNIIDATNKIPTSAWEWCRVNAVYVDCNGYARLYKCIDADFNAGHLHILTNYTPGTTVDDTANFIANGMIGDGLHASPSPVTARNYASPKHFDPKTWRYVEVLAKVDTLDVISTSNVKAPVLKVVREVDFKGEPCN